MIGKRFNHLIVLSREKNSTKKESRWLCVCDCGNKIIILGRNLNSNHTKSCGCLRKKHGNCQNKKCSLTYISWREMKKRCYNSHCRQYKWYGEKGIQVCKEWKNNFLVFLKDMGERPSSKHSIDRKNNNGNYEPSNCKWSTQLTQVRNRSNNHMITFKNQTKCLSEWGEIFNLEHSVILKRIKLGWSIENLFNPSKKLLIKNK